MPGVLQEWYQVAGIILALPTSVALVWGIVRVVRHLGLVHEAIIGRIKGPANDAIPSMIERFESINEHLSAQDGRLDRIESHLETDTDHPLKPLRSVNGK